MLSSTLPNEHIQWDEKLFVIIKRIGIQSDDSQNSISSYFKITLHEKSSGNWEYTSYLWKQVEIM